MISLPNSEQLETERETTCRKFDKVSKEIENIRVLLVMRKPLDNLQIEKNSKTKEKRINNKNNRNITTDDATLGGLIATLGGGLMKIIINDR